MADYKKVKIVNESGTVMDEINVKDETARNGLTGKVNKSGDTMTGYLTILCKPDPTLVFKEDNNSLGNIVFRDNNFFIKEYAADQQTFSANFNLPKPDLGMTTARWYDILTSKTPVTPAQGGTGGGGGTWSTVPVDSNNVASGTIHYINFGYIVFVSTNDLKLKNALSSSGSINVGVLPSGYRPAYNIDLFANVLGHPTQIKITTGGGISVYYSGYTIETNQPIEFGAMFVHA